MSNSHVFTVLLPLRCPILVSYDSEWILVSSNSLSCTNASWEYFWYHSGSTTLVGEGVVNKAGFFNGGSELFFDILKKLSFQRYTQSSHNRLNAKKRKQKTKQKTAVLSAGLLRSAAKLQIRIGALLPERHGLDDDDDVVAGARFPRTTEAWQLLSLT